MTGISLKYTIKTDSRLQMLEFYVKFVALKRNIKIPDNDAAILAYFMEYGLNEATKSKILDVGLLKNNTCLRNSVSRIRKNGWIIKNLVKPFGEKLCKELDLTLGDVNIIKVLLDNR